MRDIAAEQVLAATRDRHRQPAARTRAPHRSHHGLIRSSAATTSLADGIATLGAEHLDRPRAHAARSGRGSLPTKIATSGTPSAAARCSRPVSTPTTNAAPAISRATASSGCRSGTRAARSAAAIRVARSALGARCPTAARQIDAAASQRRAELDQFASGHSFSGRAVACSSTP